MTRKKLAQTIFRHDELSSDPIFGTRSPVPGLSVIIRSPHYDHEQFKQHFRSDFTVMMLITKGGNSFSLNLKPYNACKNDLIVVSPNMIKQLIDVLPESEITVISFTTEFFSKMKASINKYELTEYFSTQFSPIWHLSPKDATTFSLLAKQLLHCINNIETHPYGKELLHHTFNIFFLELAALGKKYAKPLNNPLSRKENLVIQFINLVQHHFRSQRSVQDYANQLNITPKYLTEAVKEISGKTAGEIIDDYVLLEAKVYLHNPEFSIAQIADELNFSDQSFFGKFFKRFTGLSPKEYRQSL